MKSQLDKNQIERFSRKIVLKNIGPLGQKKYSIQRSLLLEWEDWDAQSQNF